jgi:hypothetical protein
MASDFALGPKGHYAIGYFLTARFNQITEATVVADFTQLWRPMIEFMLLGEEWRQAILRDGAMACSARKNTKARQNWRNSLAECFRAINRTVIRND